MMPSMGSPSSLRSRAVKGGRWSLVEGTSVQLLSMAGTVVLVRILSPAEYGAIAALFVLAGLAELVVDSGFGLSLMRRPELDESYLSSVFWFICAVGAITATALIAIRGNAAEIVGAPTISQFIPMLVLSLAFSWITIVPRNLLSRRFEFKRLAQATIAGQLVYLAVSVGLAVSGFGVWSVVIGRVVKAGVMAVAIFLMAGWLPVARASVKDLRSEVSFGGPYWASGLLSYLGKNGDYWVVSRLLGSASLGAYFNAFVLPDVVRQRLTGAVQKPLLVTLGEVQTDRIRFATITAEVVNRAVFVAAPALLGLAAITPIAVGIFFGQGWQAVEIPMAVLCGAAVFEVMTVVFNTALTACGYTKSVLLTTTGRLAVLAAGLAGLVLLDGMSLGAVSSAVFLASVSSALFAGSAAVRRTGLRVGSLAVAFKAIAAGFAMAASVRLAMHHLWTPIGVQLVLLTLLGVALYWLFGFILMRSAFHGEVTASFRLLRGG